MAVAFSRWSVSRLLCPISPSTVDDIKAKNCATCRPSARAWCAWIETGMVQRPPASLILPKVMRGAESAWEKSRACEIEVKSNQGRTE